MSGEQASLSCNVSGDPFPLITFKTALGEVLDDSVFTHSGKYSKRETSSGSELIIREVESNDSGEWLCIASNFMDEVDQMMRLIVEKKESESADNTVMYIGMSMVGLVLLVLVTVGGYYLYKWIKRRKLQKIRDAARKRVEEEQTGMRM